MSKPEKSSGWGCTVCGYIFTPGMIDGGKPEIDPAQLFDGLPPDWKCPECGSGKHKLKLAKPNRDKKA